MSNKHPMLKCRVCGVCITQQDADEAWEIVGVGHETMCQACATSIARTEPAPAVPGDGPDKATPRDDRWVVSRTGATVSIIIDPMYYPVQDQLIPVLTLPRNGANEALCERIVRTVNSHAALVEACDGFLRAGYDLTKPRYDHLAEQARAALALAREVKP